MPLFESEIENKEEPGFLKVYRLTTFKLLIGDSDLALRRIEP